MISPWQRWTTSAGDESADGVQPLIRLIMMLDSSVKSAFIETQFSSLNFISEKGEKNYRKVNEGRG